MSSGQGVVVDIHTHMYPPAFVELLKSRDAVPYIRDVAGQSNARLVILPGEDDQSIPIASRGRPVGPEYWDIKEKMRFMDAHDIDISVISLANPWLDFVDQVDAAHWAKKINDNMNQICLSQPARLFAFGTLPLSGTKDDIVAEIDRLKSLGQMRGVVMGTTGLGQGLDDRALDEVYLALESSDTVIFLHPHYGLPSQVYGPRAKEYGHVLPLALGFPLETTIAVSRMLLSGVFDRYPRLKVLLAHSGGTLPFLAGRIESCIAHDGHLKREGLIDGRRSIREVLKSNFYLDAVVYSEVGLRPAIEASGVERVMFGTDHPFFPPLSQGAETWPSVTTNYEAVLKTFPQSDREVTRVLGQNAVDIFRLRPGP